MAAAEEINDITDPIEMIVYGARLLTSVVLMGCYF